LNPNIPRKNSKSETAINTIKTYPALNIRVTVIINSVKDDIISVKFIILKTILVELL
jgi:hypothetical protein